MAVEKGKSPLDTWTSSRNETLFRPRARSVAGTDSRAGQSLPPELRKQATQRIRLIAITYSLAFFFADLFPTFLTRHMRERLQEPIGWVPTVVSILFGLVVAVVVSNRRLSWDARVNVGLALQVLGSYGIAMAQYIGLPRIASSPHVLGMINPSWVAIWMLFYSVVVPAPPRRALLAMIASASAPPVVIGLTLRAAEMSHLVSPLDFFFGYVFPYMICVGLAYIGARVVYRLGTDVGRARELGSYRLIERLGEGGMGEVWKASHQLLARPAAIKFIRPEAVAGSDPESARLMLKRFELEAQATASMTSAHTVNLYDFGVTDSGIFYYVMELLDGLDCECLVSRYGPLPPARLVHVLTQVCESLDEAHRVGLIHRDVKPANIYVCRNGNRFDFVKVLDFGLVSRSSPGDKVDGRLTLPEQAVGTPAYMPPEVALGQKIDGRADLYALGCVAYWLATGRPAFEGASVYELVSNHLHATPESPSRHAPAPLPADLEAAILQCLEKSPEKRPASARELSRRLRSVCLDQTWGDDEAEAWWSTHRPSGDASASIGR